MNNYNDYLMNNLPYDMNYMNTFTDMSKNFNINNVNSNIDNVQTGFLKGNMFNNLYDPFENYKYEVIKEDSERSKLLNEIRMFKFALIDLDLYLDVKPGDVSAINLYNNYLNQEKILCDEYERNYGPLSLSSNYLGGNYWSWVKGPWPWEGEH